MQNKLYVSKCRFGKGIFAKGNIIKGEEILEFSGPLIDTKQTKLLGDKECTPLQIENDIYILLKNPCVFVNHSCNPNAGVKSDKILIAIKNIKKDEQIFYDYSTTMDEDHFTMQCECGEVNCRKIVKDFKYLPSDVREKYLKLGIVQNFIAKQYVGVLLAQTPNPPRSP